MNKDKDTSAEQTTTLIPAVEKQGINISGDTVTLKTAEYPEAHRHLVRWLYAYAKDNAWTWDDLARNLKISTTTMWRVWQDKYVNTENGERIDLSNLCEKIARFKALAEDRAGSGKMPFIETSVFKRVDKICREALVTQSIAMIYGESQIGKSASLIQHTLRNNHGQTNYVLMPAAAGKHEMMKAIARACHISERTSFDQLRDRVADFLDPSKLLIIDEIHECFVSYQKTSMVKCLSVLRQLQEVSQCGLVLCGTNVFRHEIEQGEFAQSLKQLRKRGIWELQLENTPADEDLQLIAKFYKLPNPDNESAELVRWIAREMGLGKYTKFMARAAQLAAKRDEKYSWAHFTKVVQTAEKMRTKP